MALSPSEINTALNRYDIGPSLQNEIISQFNDPTTTLGQYNLRIQASSGAPIIASGGTTDPTAILYSGEINGELSFLTTAKLVAASNGQLYSISQTEVGQTLDDIAYSPTSNANIEQIAQEVITSSGDNSARLANITDAIKELLNHDASAVYAGAITSDPYALIGTGVNLNSALTTELGHLGDNGITVGGITVSSGSIPDIISSLQAETSGVLSDFGVNPITGGLDIAPTGTPLPVGDTNVGTALESNSSTGLALPNVQEGMSTNPGSFAENGTLLEYYPAGETLPPGVIPIDPSYTPPAAPTSGADDVSEGMAAADSAINAAANNWGDSVAKAGQIEAGINGALEGLGAIGAAALAYQTGEAIGTAINQYEAGDYQGAAETIADTAGYDGGGIAGAIAGGEIGAAAGGEAGFFFGGPIGAAVGAGVGALVGSIAGFVGGSQLGEDAASGLLNDVENGLSDLENELDGAISGLGQGIAGGLFGPDGLFGPNGPFGPGGPFGPDGPLGLPSGFLKGLESLFGASHDPLVVDLTGCGINIEDSSNPHAPYFDFSGGDFDVKTSWIGSGNAFLVVQSTNSALGVSIGGGYELLGTGSESGFAVLQSLDSNGDGKIDASDLVFASLAVWKNGAGDGTFDPVDVASLADAGITSISLKTSDTNTAIGGSTIIQTSTVTFSNGTSTQIAQVELGYNPDETVYTGDYTETAQIADLANIRGYGNVANLDVAMSLDPTLTDLVQNLVSDTPDSMAGFDSAVQSIMYEWAGVEAVSPSAGNIFDGQKVDFLADYLPYASEFATNGRPPWFIGQAIAVNGAWNSVLDTIEAQFLVQLPNTALAANFTYQPLAGDIIVPDTYDLGATIKQIASDAPSSSVEGLTYWLQALLVINQSASDILRVQNAFGVTNTAYQIGSDAFVALSSEPYFSKDIMNAALSGNLTYIEMSALNSVVYGTTGSDLFDVTQSNMTIEGFGGGDEIIVNPGVANLNINEVENNPANTNVLFIAPGISEANVVVSADASGDIILTYDAQGDQVTLDSMLYGPTSGSEQGPLHTSLPYTPSTEFGVQDVVFADGTTWTSSQVIDMLQDNGSPTNTTIYAGTEAATLDPAGYANLIVSQGGADTILFNAGYGDLTIDQADATGLQQSVLQFGSGISAGEILASGDANGDIILTLGTTGTQITLDGMASSGQNGIGEAAFADGTTLTAEQLIAAAGVGSPANTVLYANADTSLLDPDGYAHAVIGATSSDIIAYKRGYGDLTISQSDGSPVLAFGSGVSEANIVVSQDGQGDIILTDLATGATIDLAGMASNGTEISAATFSDGTTWSAAQILEMGDTGNIYNQALYAEAGYNVFDPNGYAHYVQDNTSGSTIIYSLGDGNLTVSASDYSGILQFGAGISASDISVTTTGYGALILTVGSTGSQITLENQLNGSGIGEFTFADGTTWSLPQILTLANTGSATNTYISVDNNFDSTIDPAGFAHSIDLGGPSSTILYNIGYGPLTIYEGAPTNPTTLALGAGITASDISVTNLGENTTPYYWSGFFTLNISTGTQVSEITIYNFSPINGYDGFGQIDFADGTTLSASSILAMADIGSALNTTLWADSSDNLFDPQGYAHTIYTEGDLSTVLYNPGYGALQVYGDQNTTIEFGASITESEVSIVPSGNGDFILNVGTGSDQITLQNGGDIGAVDFADGTTWTEATLLQIADTGSYQGETLTPAAPLNQFYENGIWWLQSANIFNSNGYASEILSTLSGSDTILYNQGYGSLTVDVSTDGYAPYYWDPYYKTFIQNNDVLQFGTGITASEITVEQDASGDLILNVGGTSDVITLVDMLSNAPSSGTTSNPQYGVASAVFADGTTLTAQQLIQLSETGSAENNQTLSSPFTGTTFYTNGYVHQVNGAGDDTIVYNANGGDLVVNEIYQGSILQLGTGISETDVQVAADSNGDVILQIGDAANLITLTGMNYALAGIYQDPQAYDVASVVFADGTTWTSTSILSMLEVGSTFNNSLYSYNGGETFNSEGVATYIQDYDNNNDQIPSTFLYNPGYGMLTIATGSNWSYENSQNILQLGAGIDPSAVTVSSDASGDIVLTDGVPGDTIVVQGMLDAASNGVGDITFADGTTWSSQQILALADIGSLQGTTLYAGYEPNVFDPNRFAHLIVDDNDSTILYNEGYGNLEIQAALDFVYVNRGGSGGSGGSGATGYYKPDESTLVEGAGISASDLFFVLNEQGGIVAVIGTEHARITLDSALTVGTPNFVFTDGTTLTSAEIIADAEANGYGLTLSGGTGTDTLAPAGQYSTILGQGGADTILFDLGDGSLDIVENNYAGPEQSVLQFGSGISANDLIISSDSGNDILVTIPSTGDQITLVGMLDNSSAGVAEFAFSDGSTLYAVEITAEAQIGSPENDGTLYANGGVNTFVPNGYATAIVDNGGGVDTIIYGLADGNLQIDVSHPNQADEQNILSFASGIAESSISVSSDGQNVLLTNAVTGAEIEIVNMLSGTNNGVPYWTPNVGAVVFSDGTTWTAQQIDFAAFSSYEAQQGTLVGSPGADTLVPGGQYQAILGEGGADTIVYAAGDGNLTIDEQVSGGQQEQSILQFGPGILADDLTISADAADDILVTIGSAGAQITLSGMLDNLSAGVTEFAFSDGSTLSAAEITAEAQIGSPENDGTLYANGGVNTFVPNGYATAIVDNGGGVDTIIYGLADGNLQIDVSHPNQADEQNILSFASGIAESSISISSDGRNVFLTNAVTGAQIEIANMLSNTNKGVPGGQPNGAAVAFSDGTTWTAQQIDMIAFSSYEAQQGILVGSPGADTIVPGGQYQAILGEGGADTIVYAAGDGNLTIDEQASGWQPEQSIIQFGSGISESDISVSAELVSPTNPNGNAINAIVLHVGTTGSQITLLGMLENDSKGVSALEFADGVTLTAAQLGAAIDIGSKYNQTIYSVNGNQTLVPNGAAHTIIGSGAADTIVYNLGDGNLTIYENHLDSNTGSYSYGSGTQYRTKFSGEQSVLAFGSGITPGDILFSQNNEGGVVLTNRITQAQIVLPGMAANYRYDYTANYYYGDSYNGNKTFSNISNYGSKVFGSGVGYVEFSDGVSLSAQQVVSLSAGYDTLVSSGSGNSSYGWSDTLVADGIYGVVLGDGGQDTILYGSDDGNLTISEEVSNGLKNQNILQFTSGVTNSDLIYTKDNAGDIIVIVESTHGAITLSQMAQGSSFGVSEILFSDGGTLSSQQILDAATITVINATTLSANGGANTLDPAGFAHEIDDIDAVDTIIYERGYGNLNIHEQTSLAPEASILQLGTAIAVKDIAVRGDASGDVLLTDTVTGAQITLSNMLNSGSGGGFFGVGEVVFTGTGTTISAADIAAEADTGSAANTTLYGGTAGSTLVTNGYAEEVDGNGGADTILYTPASGNLLINEQASGANLSSLQFGPGISQSNITISSDANGDVVLGVGTTGSEIVLNRMADESSHWGVGSVAFSDGTTWTAQQVLNILEAEAPPVSYGTTLTGSAGNSNLVATSGNNIFDPNGFAHGITDKHGGSDEILYRAGDGDLHVNEFNPNGTERSFIDFGTGISAGNITAVGDASGDIVLTVTSLGTQITLSGMLTNFSAGVGRLEFADGTSLTASQLVTIAETGTPTNSTLYGNAYGVELEPNGPVHMIDLGMQADSIDYEAGNGNLTINGTYAIGGGQAGDILAFGTGISASDLSASSPNGNDLILTIGTSGSKITLSNMLASGHVINSSETLNYGVSEITFADGTTLSADQVIALLNTGSHLNTTLSAGSGDNTLDPAGYAHVVNGEGGTDTILYNRGYGNLLINEQIASGPEQSVLELGSSIAVADIAISGDAHGDILLTDTVTGAQITLASMLESGANGVAYGIGSIEFDSSGTTRTAAQLIADAETGTPVNTTLFAGAGDTTFQSGGYAQVINGNGGADTILYTPAAGDLQINEFDPNGPQQSVLQFGSGVSASDLSIFTDGYGDVIVQLGTTGDEIGLTGMLSGTQYGVGSFVFADGTTLSAAQIEAGLGTIAAASTTLYSTLSSETLDTKGYFSAIQGNGGADTIIYNAGYGNLSITEQSYPDPEQSVLQFGTGISEADVAVSEDSNGDIILGIGSPAAQITLVGMLESNLNGVAAVEFSDGTTWTAAQVIAMTETGSPDHTTLVGGPGNNVFNPNGYAHVIDGNGGADTILFNLGDGRVTVNEENQTGPELSVLQFGTGIAAANISASQDAYGDIILTIGTAGDAVVLSNMIDSGLDGISFGVGSATFVDGTTLSAQQVTNLAETGSATNTVLRAGPDGDTIDPNGYARLVLGGAGTNTVRYNQGYGALTIDEQASGTEASVLQFCSGISAAELSATTDAAGDIILTVGNQADQITLTSMATSLSFGIGEAVFADGTTLSAAQLDALAASASFASSFSGISSSIATTDELAVTPFASLSIADLNTGSPVDTITVSLSNNANGSLYDPNAQTDGAINANGILTIAGSASEVSTILDALIFVPTAHQVAPGNTVATTLTVNDVNSTGLESSASLTVTATAVEDAPVISGAASGQIATDKTSLNPFANVIISDPDFGANETVTITVTGTNGLATDANGTLSGTGLTEISAGVYTLVAGAPPSLTAELDELIFTPAGHQVAPGSTVTTGFTITVAQNELVTTNTTASIIATAANDPAVITGTQAGQATSDEAKLDPFSGVNISDPDLGVTETATITLTGSAGVATDADGTLSGAGLTKIGVGTYSLAAATAAGLTAELEALSFSPTAHQVSPGQTVATGFTLAVTQDGVTTTDTVTSVIATAANDAPVISGAVAGQTITDEASAKPFSGVRVTDPDLGAADSVTITLTGTSGLATDADGTLSGTGLTKTGIGLYTLSAATPASLTAELEALTFSPTVHQTAPGSTVTTGFALAVTQNGLTSTNTVSSVIATAVNDAPVISGTNAGQLTTDEAPVNPFSGLVISDPDFGVTETATIAMTGANGLATDAEGTLSGTGLTKIGAGLYTLAAATPASLTAELEALIFAPTAHQVAPGSTVSTGFTVAVTQNGVTATDGATSVIATAVNDVPVIAGTRAGQTATDEASVNPFSGVTISDTDVGVVEAVTITLAGSNGLATDADGSLSGSGLSKIGTGLYALAAATPAILTAELEALTFSPTAHQVAPGGTVATGFTLAVTQNGVTTTDNVSSVIVTAANDAPVISGAQAGQVTTDEASLKPFSGVTISDVDLGATDSMAITLTGTNGLVTDSDGILSGTGLTKIGTGLYSLAATSPASLTAELDSLTFSPTAHQVAPGSTVTTGFTLAVTQNGLTTANTVSSVLATAVNDAPVISGAVAGQTTTDEAGVKPFSSITVSDPDLGVADSVQITLTGTSGLATDADGALTGAGLTKIGTGLYTLAAATPGSLTAELEGLTFSPTAHQVAPGGTVATGFTLAVTQNGLTTVNTSSSVTATAVNDAPVISGAKSGQPTTDAASVKPFSSVIISDPDLGVTETVMITLTGTSGVATDADGILSGTGLTKIGTGLYTLAAASPASMTAELEALTFSPTAHQVAAGTVTTEFNLAVTQNGLTTTNTATSVIATASAATLVSNGTLYALQSGETLNTGGTVNVVNDGSFANTIIYNKGNGQLTIENSNPAGANQSILQLGSGISETALTVLSDAAGDILLKDGVTGDQITLTGMMTSLDNGVSSIAFADGTSWTAAELTELATLGTATAHHGLALGSGPSTISGAGVFVVGAGIAKSNVIFESNNSNGNLTIALLGANGQLTGDSVTISGYWWNYKGQATVLFPDGSTLAVGNPVLDTWVGSATQTTLVGSNFSPNLFDIGPGGDQITLGATYNGGNGQNTLAFGYGDGAVIVTPNNASATIALGANILPSEVAFQSNNGNGNLTVELLNASGQPTGDSLTINGYWYNTSGTNLAVFANGTTLALNHQLTDTWIGTATQTTLVGSNFSPNQFDLAPGGDQVTLGASSNGGNGQNTLEFGYGDGAVTVVPNQASATIALGANILPSEVIFQSNNNNGNLTVDLLNANGQLTGDSLTINGYWWNSSGTNLAVFANGTTLALNHQLTDTWIGSTSQTVLVGSNFSPNIFDLAPGGDQVTLGANYNGGNGQNVVNFGIGDGAVMINGNNGLATISLASGINLAGTTLSTDSSGDVILALSNGTDKLTVAGGMYSSAFQQLDFANGTTLSHSQILYTAETGTTGNDTITAPSGAEVIDGHGGNDVINGGGGYDTYVYRQGYGNLAINNAASGGTVANGELDFGPGITEQDLWFSRSGNNLDINVLGSKSQIAIDNWYGSNSGAQLKEIKAYDGLEIDSGLNQLVAAMAVFETNNPAFNPQTALQMPSDTNLQAALAAVWHA